MGTLPRITEDDAGFDEARGMLARLGSRDLRARRVPIGPRDTVLARALVAAVLSRAAFNVVGELGRVVEQARAAIERHVRGLVARMQRSERTPLDRWNATRSDPRGAPYIEQWARDARVRLDAVVALYAARGESPAALLRALDTAFAAEWWRIERVLRTESAHAANAAAVDAVRVLSAEHGDARKRWVEMVDDHTGVPLDDRVANDSLVMHGQVQRWDEPFVMPRARIVHERMWGQRWAFPPNRPNDRAIVLPWRPGWGVPGWEFKDGKRRVLVAGPRPDLLDPEGQTLNPHVDDD